MAYFKGKNLKPGIHELTWEQFEEIFGQDVVRRDLILGIKRAIKLLIAAGCQKVYIDGSFVTKKKRPRDYDMCWDEERVDLKKLSPLFIEDRGFKYNSERKKLFQGDIYPAKSIAHLNPSRTFLEFFQVDKDTGRPKGIICLNLTEYDQE